MDYKRIFNCSPNLFLLLSPDLTIIDASDAYLSATLTRREEISGRALFEVFPDNPDDPHADGVSNLHASLDLVLRTRASHAMAVQKYDIRNQDGSFEERYWSPLNTPVLDDAREVLYIIHKVEDVTEMVRVKKEAEDEYRKKKELEVAEQKYLQNIKDSEDRFFKIFNLSPVAIYMTDIADGRFLYVNKAFEQLFLMRSEDVIGRTVMELNITNKSNREDAIARINEKGGRAVELEVELCIANGEIKKMLLSTEVVEIDEKKCFLVALVDITGRKKVETELRYVNNELEAFTYSVSHDLRAPLRAVTGFARILEEDYAAVLDEEGRRLLRTISGNAEKMGILIDDLLLFSRLGRKELQKTDTDMNALVESAIAEVKKTTQHKAAISVGQLPHVRSDTTLMKQVLINLIGNAIKYSSKNEHAELAISSAISGDEAVFSFRDNGVGFDMRYADKLFGVFQRLHSTDEFDGTGVGLAIVQRIVNRHGGRVWAESKPDEGATFSFSIPFN